MIVTVVAHTRLTELPASLSEGEFFEREDWQNDARTSDIDLLGELAGRGCYKSWRMPNQKTAENAGYLENILLQKHYSILEHGSVTFYVEGVSRALLLELERHRHVSFSVESQRFVDTGKHHPYPVIPPLMQGHAHIERMLEDHYANSLALYDKAYNEFRDAGVPVKQAREAARAFLLESTPVDLFFTGNIRALRDVLGKRWSTHADAEIREFAGLILEQLRVVAPNSVQDLPEDPYDE